MAKTHTILQVFLASPSDVTDERTLLADVVSEFNNTWGKNKGVMLELLKWETHSQPGFGADAQDVINKQIGDEYDIFIGIMWGRFGSPTLRAGSGTEEEFNRAFARLADSSNNIQIMFYFKDAGIPPSQIDAVQLQKVQEFKKKISSDYGGLYHSFESAEQFQTSVRMHLSTVVQNWLDADISITPDNVQENTVSLKERAGIDDPLANLSALEIETDEDGVIELIELADEAMSEVTNIVVRMTDATNFLNDSFTVQTVEANKVAESGSNMKAAKRVSNKAAADLEVFVKRMSVEILEFNKQSSRAMETFGSIAMIAEKDFEVNQEAAVFARTNMQMYTDAISSSAESLKEFRDSIFNLPQMTTAFNRARKRAVAVMDDLLNQLRLAANQSMDVDALLARIQNTGENDQ